MSINDLHHKSTAELQKLIEEAQAQLVVKQQVMRKDVIAKIKELAASIGATVEIHDHKQAKQMASVAARYQNPENHLQTWSGRGLAPKWLRALIAEGYPKEAFLIQN